MRTNAAGINLILGFEGFRSCPYDDGRGVPTIGYGHTRGVTFRSPCISKSKAHGLFVSDLVPTERALSAVLARYGVKVNRNEFSAFVSFGFNLGTGIYDTSHDFGRHLKSHDVKGAVESMSLYYNPGSTVAAGLLRRRHAEQALARRPLVRLTRGELMVKAWEVRLVQIRAAVQRIGRWTPKRKAEAKALKQDIRNHGGKA